MSAAIKPIAQPYLLVLFSVPFYVDADGRRWIEGLWAKDLIEHMTYINRLTLATRAVRAAPPANAIAIDQEPRLQNLRCVDLPDALTRFKAIISLPRTCRLIWREIGLAQIVHSSVAAWPIPEAWLLVPMLLLRKRIFYINVESAFWRTVPGYKVSRYRRVKAAVVELLNRYCVERSDISTFTHEGYRNTLLRSNPDRGHVIEASWIDENMVLSGSELASTLDRRSQGVEPLRLVFAGRLTREKGVLLLMQSMADCLHKGVKLELDIYGEGPLKNECVAIARDVDPNGWTIRFCDSLPYDQHFFRALRTYDALVVPSFSDEQPRIVYDAYSQGLPVIASRTAGLLQCVEEGVTGLSFNVGDALGLTTQLSNAAAKKAVLAGMASACLERAHRLTHQNMHRARWHLLINSFPELAASKEFSQKSDSGNASGIE